MYRGATIPRRRVVISGGPRQVPPRAAAAPATAFGSFGFSTSAFAPASSTPRSPRASHLICHAAVASSPCGGDPVLPRNFSLAPNVLPRITGPPPPPPLGPPRHLTHRFDETFDRLQPRSVSLSSPLLSLATRSSLYDIRVSIYICICICIRRLTILHQRLDGLYALQFEEKKREYFLLVSLIVPSARDDETRGPKIRTPRNRCHAATRRTPDCHAINVARIPARKFHKDDTRLSSIRNISVSFPHSFPPTRSHTRGSERFEATIRREEKKWWHCVKFVSVTTSILFYYPSYY